MCPRRLTYLGRYTYPMRIHYPPLRCPHSYRTVKVVVRRENPNTSLSTTFMVVRSCQRVRGRPPDVAFVPCSVRSFFPLLPMGLGLGGKGTTDGPYSTYVPVRPATCWLRAPPPFFIVRTNPFFYFILWFAGDDRSVGRRGLGRAGAG